MLSVKGKQGKILGSEIHQVFAKIEDLKLPRLIIDGTAKGGVVFAIADKHTIPIRYLGVGEGIDDLRPFNGSDFIDALFTQES